MAVQTPFHGQRLFLPRQRHLINPTMAGNAPDTLLDVDRVMEIDEIGEIVAAGSTPAAHSFSDWRAPARASDCQTRSANGTTCRCRWVANPRKPRSPPSCGNTGNQFPGPARDARARRAQAVPGSRVLASGKATESTSRLISVSLADRPPLPKRVNRESVFALG